MSTSTLPRWAQVFIPTKEVKVTPIILSANVLIWLIMVASGVDFMLPGVDELRAWGSCSATDVGNGDYWRLFTSNYLHFGIIHLAVNMLSLNNVGRMLEQFIGPWRFAVIYTLTGIAASAVSIWWNPFANGVGASGAILGIVGLLLALLTTNLIERTARFRMLRSMGISAGLMILISFQANVDNAAHLGGLVGGMIGGYFIFPELKAHYYAKKKQFIGLLAFVFVISGGTVWFVTHAKGLDPLSILKLDSEFDQGRAAVESNYINGFYKTPQQINDTVIEYYSNGVMLMDLFSESIENPESAELYRKKAKYLEARKTYYQWVVKDLQTNKTNSDSTRYWENASDSLLTVMKSR